MCFAAESGQRGRYLARSALCHKQSHAVQQTPPRGTRCDHVSSDKFPVANSIGNEQAAIGRHASPPKVRLKASDFTLLEKLQWNRRFGRPDKRVSNVGL
jgi:hypothetical protein